MAFFSLATKEKKEKSDGSGTSQTFDKNKVNYLPVVLIE